MTANWVGKVGSWLAFGCAIHCIAMPLLISLFPVAAGFFEIGEGVELGLLLSAVALASLSLCWGYRKHRKFDALWALLGGIAWYTLGHVYHHSVLFSLLGGAFFLLAHYINHRLCKTCTSCGIKHG